MSGDPNRPVQRGPTFDSMNALDSLQKIMDSEMGQELQRRMSEDEDTVKAVFEGLKDVRRMEDVILDELGSVKGLIETLRNEVRVLKK